MNKDNIIAFINKKIEDSIRDPILSTKEYALIKSTYLTIISFINEYEPPLAQPGVSETYEVDYSCPDRNSFIETVEKSV